MGKTKRLFTGGSRTAAPPDSHTLSNSVGYLGFHDDHQRIELVKNVRGKEMSWTLGQTLRMLVPPVPSHPLEPPTHHSTSAPLPPHKEL